MYGGTFSKNEKGGETLASIAGFVAAVIMLMLIIGSLLRYLSTRQKSKSSKMRTATPRVPHWLAGNLCGPKLKKWDFPPPDFCVYTKEYNMERFNNRGRLSEKDQKIVKKMRRLLGDMFDLICDYELFPPSTCIVSIPRRNFRNGPMPGTFVPIHGGPPDSRFEFQMIGDDRIQVAYYVVDGVEYVAGFCIYIENPYQETIHYSESVIRNLMTCGPEYWSTTNLQEEKMEIGKRTDYKPKDFMLITKNRYGVEKHWLLDDERKYFRDVSPFRKDEYEAYDDEDPKNQLPFLSVKMCPLEREMVTVAQKNGRYYHAVWNRDARKMQLFDCPSCEHQQDAPPPSYASTIEKESDSTKN